MSATNKNSSDLFQQILGHPLQDVYVLRLSFKAQPVLDCCHVASAGLPGPTGHTLRHHRHTQQHVQGHQYLWAASSPAPAMPPLGFEGCSVVAAPPCKRESNQSTTQAR